MEQSLQEGDWLLAPFADNDLDEIMSWFPSADATNIWGGPRFRYPFTRDTFFEDCHVGEMASYSLWNSRGELAAFGQSYDREGRGHLARLVTNPALRRQGVGRQLILMIIEALELAQEYDEFSLFVYRDNLPAYRCYLSLGFVVDEYPEGAPMLDKSYFLTKKAKRRDR